MARKIPSDIIISDVELTQNIPVYKTTSSSERVRVRDRGLHYVTGSLTLTSDNPRALEGFLLGLKNSVEAFDLELGGDRFNSQTITSGVPAVNADVGKGSTSIPLTGYSGKIVIGDVFNTANTNKIYYVVEGGTSLIKVYPPLMEDIPDGETLSFKNVRITARLEDTDQRVTYDEQGLIVSCSVDFREVL